MEKRSYLYILIAASLWGCIGVFLKLLTAAGLSSMESVAVRTALSALLYGLIGMNAGLKWAKLDYISEAYPCKQSVAVMVSMFGSMGIPMALGLLYIFVLADHLAPTVYLSICTAALALACFGLYKLLTTWGAKKWESLG